MTLITGSKNIFIQYYRNRFLSMAVLLGVLFNIMTWLLLAYHTNVFPGTMPLHYNIYYGIDSYGPWFYIFIMPVVGLVVLISNILLSLFVLRQEKALSYLLVGSAGFIQLIILISAFTVVAINQ